MPFTNLIRSKPSQVYFARFRIKGKLIRCCLKISLITVAKLRLVDLEKVEQGKAASFESVAAVRMTFGDALSVFESRFQADPPT